MANWPDSPGWSDPKTINAGNQYNAADGVLYTDMNKIISNLLYLKQRGGIIPTGTLSIVSNNTYDVAKYAFVEVNVPQTGGGDNKLASLVGGTPTEITADDLAGVTKLIDYAFFFSTLTSITIPNSVTSIGHFVFKGCSLLTSVIISNSVTKIGSNAFEKCTSLVSITIPDSVTSIGGSALQIGSTTNKATIIMLSTTPPTIQANTFNSSYLQKIIVPAGTGATYKAATNWSNFADYIEEVLPQLATPQNVTADGTVVSWDEVENATSYEIFADGTSIGTVEQLATPQNVTANGTTVSWDAVENATSYAVLADGNEIGTVQ